MSDVCIAVVGATGAVGREMIAVLEERGLPLERVRLLASANSAGEYLEVGGREVVVEELKEDSFKGIDIALFSAGGDTSKHFSPLAAKAGTVVVDNSSAFRMDSSVPLIVPEVNSEVLRKVLRSLSRDAGCIIANPNCSKIGRAHV